jgi:hypothetical protein
LAAPCCGHRSDVVQEFEATKFRPDAGAWSGLVGLRKAEQSKRRGVHWHGSVVSPLYIYLRRLEEDWNYSAPRALREPINWSVNFR